jgi:hypothetical protein
MSEPQLPFFSVTDYDGLGVTTALIQGDVLMIAKDDRSVWPQPLGGGDPPRDCTSS